MVLRSHRGPVGLKRFPSTIPRLIRTSSCNLQGLHIVEKPCPFSPLPFANWIVSQSFCYQVIEPLRMLVPLVHEHDRSQLLVHRHDVRFRKHLKGSAMLISFHMLQLHLHADQLRFQCRDLPDHCIYQRFPPCVPGIRREGRMLQMADQLDQFVEDRLRQAHPFIPGHFFKFLIAVKV